MRKTLLILLLGSLVLAGCATRYNITLNNGEVVTALSKPRLETQSSCYIFKSASGQMVKVPSFRVVEIAPASSGGSGFKTTP